MMKLMCHQTLEGNPFLISLFEVLKQSQPISLKVQFLYLKLIDIFWQNVMIKFIP